MNNDKIPASAEGAAIGGYLLLISWKLIHDSTGNGYNDFFGYQYLFVVMLYRTYTGTTGRVKGISLLGAEGSNNNEHLVEESTTFADLPVARKTNQEEVDKVYRRIKSDVNQLVEKALEQIVSAPEMEHLIIKRQNNRGY